MKFFNKLKRFEFHDKEKYFSSLNIKTKQIKLKQNKLN